jgi:cytochrome c oxidase cbb3-type subunit 3
LNWTKHLAFVAWLSLGGAMVLVAQQAPGPAGPAGGGRGGFSPRFKVYPPSAVDRGSKGYNTACGYCHGDRGKGGQAGPDLVVSVVTLHDEDGVQLAEYLKSDVHQKQAKIDVPGDQLYDIAAYLHSRVIYASGRGDIHVAEVLVGDPKAGEAYFNGPGGCSSCHSPTGDLKGVGSKYNAPTLQNKLVMPRSGRGGFGASADPAMAIKGRVTLPSGQTIVGVLVRLTDFDVTIRMEDGSTQTFSRAHGLPKVETIDPLQGHLDLLSKLTDADMHNLTSYLATLK